MLEAMLYNKGFRANGTFGARYYPWTNQKHTSGIYCKKHPWYALHIDEENGVVYGIIGTHKPPLFDEKFVNVPIGGFSLDGTKRPFSHFLLGEFGTWKYKTIEVDDGNGKIEHLIPVLVAVNIQDLLIFL